MCWQGDELVDWVSGGRVLQLDGRMQDPHVRFGYRFDSAQVSASGRFAVIYERLGTKALLLKDGRVIRELNRSYYQADMYEYPIAFIQKPDGEELIAHCPRDYCRIDIEVAESGECLTDTAARQPVDIFHSRLAGSPGGTYLLSAGWVWHPLDVAGLWRLDAVLADPTQLDRPAIDVATHDEVSSIAFIDESLLVAGFRNEDEIPGRYQLAMLGSADGQVQRYLDCAGETGVLYPVGPNHVVAFHRHPRLMDTRTGQVLHEWPDLHTGMQASSIVHHLSPLPPLALHPRRPMFAVAAADKVTVLSFTRDEPE